MERIIVSACLLGVESRHDGRAKANAAFIEGLKGRCVIPVCPEQLGGLPTPREAASFQGGDGEAVLRGEARVVTAGGRDVTQAFLKGAREVLNLARLFSVKKACFKAKSPSCGCGKVYFGDELREGVGVCTALLQANGVEVIEVG
jgi:uncharacterized protein YbbK (DUF523 family)